MDEKKLFPIGQVAKMFQVSVGTLRHYEQAGLLAPEYVAPDSGYRYYSVRQFEVLNTIRYLRVLDLSLPEIGEFLENRDVDVMEEKLQKQQRLIREKQQELARVARKIDRRLESLRDARNSELDKVYLTTVPACRMVFLKDSLQPKNYLDLEYSIRRLEENQKETAVFLGKVGVGVSRESLEAGVFAPYELVFLILDPEDRYEGEVCEQSAETCAVIRFCGSHAEAPRYYEKLWHYIRENHLTITGFSREITLIDNGLTGDPAQFVTEIRIPVSK